MSLLPFRGKCYSCGHDHDQYSIPASTVIGNVWKVGNPWTKVSDALPPKKKIVLWVGAKGSYFVGYIWKDCEKSDSDKEYVSVPNARVGRYGVAWQNIEEPPKELLEGIK